MTRKTDRDKRTAEAAAVCVELAHAISYVREQLERGDIAWSPALDNAIHEVVHEALLTGWALIRARMTRAAQLRIARGDGS